MNIIYMLSLLGMMMIDVEGRHEPKQMTWVLPILLVVSLSQQVHNNHNGNDGDFLHSTQMHDFTFRPYCNHWKLLRNFQMFRLGTFVSVQAWKPGSELGTGRHWAGILPPGNPQTIHNNNQVTGLQYDNMRG